ncbi:MAG: SGNH/GDSL hydrolase family protein [archaeon]
MEISLRFIYEDGCSIFDPEDLDDFYLCYLSENLPKSLTNFNQSSIRDDQNFCDTWDPLLGWIPKKNCDTGRYSTNSAGFRGKEEFTIEKNKTRILILGDSFTWGEDVFDYETYPYYLDQSLKGDYDIINMGVHGYGPDQMYLRFLREGRLYNPDIVILALYTPDIFRTTVRIRDFFKPRFKIVDNDLVLDENSKIPTIQEAIEITNKERTKTKIYSYLFLRKKLRTIISNLGFKRDIYSEDAYQLSFRIIEKFKEISEEDGFELIVLLIPQKKAVETNKSPELHYQLIRGLSQRNVTYVSILQELKFAYAKSKTSFYPEHLTAEGNLLIAQSLKNYLSKEKYLNEYFKK